MTKTHQAILVAKAGTIRAGMLRIYVFDLIEMANTLQADKATRKSTISPRWVYDGLACNCYWFEVLVRINQYVSKVVAGAGREAIDYSNVLVSVHDAPELKPSSESLIDLRECLWLGTYVATKLFAAWKDVPPLVTELREHCAHWYREVRSLALARSVANPKVANLEQRCIMAAHAIAIGQVKTELQRALRLMGSKVYYDEGDYKTALLLYAALVPAPIITPPFISECHRVVAGPRYAPSATAPTDVDSALGRWHLAECDAHLVGVLRS